MKQKYTLNIADIQLNVVSDAAPEEVERIAGILDRKMREIYLHSRSCTKNEAALLCALEFCADRLDNQDRMAELEELTGKYDEVLKLLRSKNEELGVELGKLQSENALLRSLLTDKGEHPIRTEQATETASTPVATPVADEPAIPDSAPARPVSAKEFLRQVAEAQYSSEPTPAPAGTSEAAPEEPAAMPERRKTGSMFDLLSFDEV